MAARAARREAFNALESPEKAAAVRSASARTRAAVADAYSAASRAHSSQVWKTIAPIQNGKMHVDTHRAG